MSRNPLPAAPSRLLLAGCWLAAFLPMLDSSIVNLALPQLAGAFQRPPADLGWVTNAYLLPFVVLIPAAARLGDATNRSRLLAAGAGLFALASAGAASAHTWPVLLAMRALQGVAASATATMSMALVTGSYPPGPERDRALAWYMSGPAFGGALGPLAGAGLTAIGGWPMMFAGQVPLALGVAAIALRRPVPGERRLRSLDPAGIALAGAFLFAVSFGLLQAPHWGWLSFETAAAWLAALASALAFAIHGRRARDPLLPLATFRNRSFLAASVAGGTVWFGVISGFMLLPLYLEGLRGFSPWTASLLLGAWPLGALVMYPFAGQVVAAQGAARAMRGALVLTALAAAAMVFYGPHTPAVAMVAVGLPLGMATAVGQVATAVGAVAGFGREDAGMAAGMFNTVRQVGSILGGALPIALAGADEAHQSALSYGGLQRAFISRLLVIAAGLLVAHRLLRSRAGTRKLLRPADDSTVA